MTAEEELAAIVAYLSKLAAESIFSSRRCPDNELGHIERDRLLAGAATLSWAADRIRRGAHLIAHATTAAPPEEGGTP